MLSESARNNSAAQSRFRVQAPNAAPRNLLVMALDAGSAGLGGRLAQASWRGARFAGFAGVGENAIASAIASLERGAFDLAVMVGTAGGDLGLAERIGSRCNAANVKVSGILLASETQSAGTIAAGLQALRPWSHTLALVRETDDLWGLLRALGA